MDVTFFDATFSKSGKSGKSGAKNESSSEGDTK
jgi:hypothetical protein